MTLKTLGKSAGMTGKRKASGARGAGYRKGDERREEILRGVTELFVRDGYRRQSLRDIGAALSIEPAHILYYFASREVLLQSVIELWDADSMRALTVDGAMRSNLDLFVAAVKRNCDAKGMGHLFLTFAVEAVDPAHVAHPFFCERVSRVLWSLTSAIRDEQAKGSIPSTVDADLAARHLMALADGLQLQVLLNAQSDAVHDLEEAVRALRAGQ